MTSVKWVKDTHIIYNVQTYTGTYCLIVLAAIGRSEKRVQKKKEDDGKKKKIISLMYRHTCRATAGDPRNRIEPAVDDKPSRMLRL